MSIAAKNSLGVFAECPHCHCSIQHGFQVCGHCGHTVSANQQQELRNLLKRNVAIYFLVFTGMLAIALSEAYKLFS